MNPCIFLAGATGAIGRRLAPLLIAAGYRVAGSTRAGEKAAGLREIGVEPIVVDVFDVDALCQAMSLVQPSVVIHQLTDLPPGLDMSKMDAAVVRNARIREVGTRNLVAAALHAGAQRLIAQSVAFAYADGALPYDETAPLNLDGEGNRGISARGVASLEQQVLTAPLDGVVLRYGRLYGPGTGFEVAAGAGAVHVDAAAKAAQLAVSRGLPGIYNLAEDDGTVASDKAVRVLGWNAAWRAGL